MRVNILFTLNHFSNLGKPSPNFPDIGLMTFPYYLSLMAGNFS